MSYLPQQNTIVQYLANGSQTMYVNAFFVPLELDGTPDMDVYVTPNGTTPVPASDIQVFGVNYTYTPNTDPTSGGTVTFLPAFVPPNLSTVTLVRDVQASLDTEFSNAQNFNGANLDTALQRLLLIEQQNKTYALQRNLSYIVNSYLPESTLAANVQIPVLGSGQVWMGSAGGVIAATLAQGSDVSTLRSELAVNAPVTNGAALVGYYDVINSNPTTVSAFLNNIGTYTNTSLYAVDTGTLNQVVANFTPAVSPTTPGIIYKVLIAHTNTNNTPSLSVIGGTDSAFINLPNGLPLLPGDLVQGMLAEFTYDTVTTGYQLLNPACGVRKQAVASSAYCSAAVNWTGTSALKVAFNTAAFDPLSLFNAGSNRFIANYAGTYRISALLSYELSGGAGGAIAAMFLFQNGAAVKTLSIGGSALSGGVLSGDTTVRANTNDYFEIWILKTDSANGQYANDGLGQTGQLASDFVFEYLGT
jgi:hypothetical protein